MIKEKHILFVDTLGRLLIGKLPEGEYTDIVTIKNPAIVHAIHKEQGGLQITIIPIVFREFLADKDTPMVFDYVRSSISIAKEPLLDVRIIGQYEQMFAPLNNVTNIPKMPDAPAQVNAPTPAIIKLFDN